MLLMLNDLVQLTVVQIKNPKKIAIESTDFFSLTSLIGLILIIQGIKEEK